MPSSTINRHRMRCKRRGCGASLTLPRDPFVGEEIPCPACGKPMRSREKQRRLEIQRQDTCRCPGIPFPHKKGSIRICIHHPRFDEWLDPEEEAQVQAMLDTPRGRPG